MFLFSAYTFWSVLWCISPIIVRAIIGQKPFGSGIEILIIILLTLSSIIFHFQAVQFVAAGIMSYKWKRFMGHLTTSLIDVNDDDTSFKEKNLMPTIVFMKRRNLEAWLKFKDAIISVGYKYTKWIVLFTSLMFLICIIYMIFLLLTYFDILKYKIPYVLWTLAIMDILTVMSVILRIIRLGASINSSWDLEIGILLDIKREMFKVIKDIDILRKKKVFSSWLSQITIEVFKIYEMTSSREEAETTYKETIEYIDQVIQSLEYKRDNKPLRILGIKINWNLEYTVYTTLASITFAVLQTYL